MTATATKKAPSELTKKRARIAIAKDVLKQLRYLTVERGYYFYVPYSSKSKLLEKNYAEDAQKHVPLLKRDCRVCALGACMISHVKLFDDCNLKPFLNNDRPDNQLGKWFSQEQLDMIEFAFETSPDGDYYGDHCISHQFGARFANHKERLRAIMKNIVANDGEFKP